MRWIRPLGPAVMVPVLLVLFVETALFAVRAAVGAESQSAVAGASSLDGAAIDFVRDIQPIFASNCYRCHDAAKHKGGLRLDSKLTAFIGGDSGDPSIVPHDSDKSKIIPLVRGDDPKAVMPPKGNRLTAQQIDLLTRWVKQGANWPDGVDHPGAALTHWAFTAPVRPPIPMVKSAGWERNPIDHFVLAKLAQQGLGPSPEADRYTLIRRLSLDLIGLPPTPAEVQEFVNDNSPDAYDKLVDRLLGNPHFGEKWARHWLDLARYADSAGYGSDPLRYTTYRWRDWVIDAFNQNKPYDQFTIEQIAGDLLPHPTTEQLIATAFNRNTMTNTEGGTDPEEYRIEAIKDRTDTTMQVWTGLTMGCAKCHTHKYDPITNREYYQVFSIFNQTEDANRGDEAPTIPTPTPEQTAKLTALNSEIDQAQAKLIDPATWTDAQAKWEKTANRPTKWTVLSPTTAESTSGTTLDVEPDGSVLASGTATQTDTYTIAVHTDLPKITAFRLEALPDPSLPHGGSGRQADGGFVLNNFEVAVPADQLKPINGRYVRIELPGHEKILSLAEVQVFRRTENIALKGKAKQSSTDFEGPAHLAIDGNTDGEFRKAKSTTHTQKSENPWWEVDLGKSEQLDKIVVWNRTDEGVGDRLSNFNVLVLDAKHQPTWQTRIGPPPAPSLTIDPLKSAAIGLANASDSFHQSNSQEWTASKLIEGDHSPNSGWAVNQKVNQPHSAVFEAAQSITAPGERPTYIFTLEQKFPNAALGHFRISATGAPRPVRVLSETLFDILAVVPEQRSKAEKDLVFQTFLADATPVRTERFRIEKLKKQLEEVKPAVTAIMQERSADKRRENHILVKGNFLSKGAVVQPGVPAAFNPLPSDAPPNRLGLAQWIVAPQNPLTSRVEVNRLWAQLFGIGIVETQEDFGTQGTLPSNQPLLDWLAIEFMQPTVPITIGGQSGPPTPWDMKRMIKLMVTSAAYRQSSRVSPDLEAKDPDNRLVARGPSKRIDAEFVRDEALALSGLLSPKMKGPSVFPPQPDGLWQAAFNGQRTYPTSTGEDRYRRGIYTFWRRTVPYPSMAAFDAPSREVCTIRRVLTSTPLQAFVTLNDPVYVECAQALGRRIIAEGGTTPEAQAKFALELCLSRPAEPRQVDRLVALHQRELERYGKDVKAATDLATGDRGPLPSGVSADDAAAWTVCANVLLNMDGVLTKR